MPISFASTRLAVALSGLVMLPVAAARAQQQTSAPLVVLISIDGMRPDYITQADAHGAKVPVLRQFMHDGTYADGVVGVVPTVTYPSHTTIMTGVWPAKHGIYNNTTFDPFRVKAGEWYWYAEDIRVPTLWDAAIAAGWTTASIQWPVTVGAESITWDIPEMWRGGSDEEDQKLIRALSTPGLLPEASRDLGSYPGGDEATPAADSVRGLFADWILEHKHPGFLTLHLNSLDDIEHATGPFSPQAIATMESLDATIGRVRATAERLAPGHAIIVVVSDHGFVPVDSVLNLTTAFHTAGLITVDSMGRVAGWKAIPWTASGSIAIVLKDTNDVATRTQVRALLDKLAADPSTGIDRILDATQLRQHEAFPGVAFWVGLKSGWRAGAALTGPVVTKTAHTGTHGGWAEMPALHAAFFMVGPGIPAGKDLGTIDMRDVAPTIAAHAGLALPTADGKNLLP